MSLQKTAYRKALDAQLMHAGVIGLNPQMRDCLDEAGSSGNIFIE